MDLRKSSSSLCSGDHKDPMIQGDRCYSAGGSMAQLGRKWHPVFAEPIGANLPSILRLAECYYDSHVKGRLMDFFLEAIKK